MNFIIGSAGFAKEVYWLLSELDSVTGTLFAIDHFVGKENDGDTINGCTVINDEQFIKLSESSPINNAFICIGNPLIRAKVYQKCIGITGLNFPSVMHPSVMFDHGKNKVVTGQGTILCAGNILTTDIRLGNFVHLNLGCTVGHDTMIDDFVTVSPGCHISGNVRIGQHVFIGTGAVILEKIIICDSAVIGAGAVVNKSINEPGTYVGIPAKKIK